ncbi:hypothetical protein Prudu_343S000200 [Prunus dulcis]|uniref:Leucine-rich repeat-containing N-terminal plant-type domain-containing protein n=1 Tax=Prunus dulcis TaxID=3755 RepID=A0A5H2XM00_PRUDU|nr:hypothetical protein Prudu_343S000200 [Prunus dulcis]
MVKCHLNLRHKSPNKYKAANGFPWNPTKKGKDCCAWSGVTCEKMTGRASRQYPSNSSLFSLGHLKRLDLSSNDFRGSPISSKFGGFVSMTHLDLSYSNFSGPVPSEISHLSTLVSLNLSHATVTLDTLSLTELFKT